MRGKGILKTSGLLLFLALNQCGLERPLLTWDAPLWEVSSGNTFRFKALATHKNDSTRYFLGYEVYYKLKKTDESFSTEEINIKDANQLEAKGFRRLYSANDSQNPLIITYPLYKTDDSYEGSEYTILIDFTNINKCEIYDEGKTRDTYEFRRSVAYGGQTPASFKHFYKFAKEDADKGSLDLSGLSNGQGFQAQIALYVVAYGRSIASNTFFAEIKSPACFLSYLTLTFVYDETE